MSLRRHALGCAAVLGALAPAAAQTALRPQPYCIRGVSLDASGAEKATLILRDGAIAAVLDESAPAPAGVRVIEGAGLICLPAFLDAYSRQGCTVPQPVKDQDLPPDVVADVGIDMRLANRKGIQPGFRAAEALALTKEQREAWRKHGFGALLVAPGGELLAGASALATTREAAMRDLVLRDEVFAHASFAATGPGYPSTLMGYFAQLRQFLLDSQRQVELELRYAQGRPGPRPPFDAELASGAALVAGERALLCEADDADDIERWLRLADEFGLSVDFAGGREAWKVREVLRARDATVVLTLDWGKEPKDPRPKEEREEERGDEAAEAAPETAPEPGEDRGVGTEAAGQERTARQYEEPYAVRLERRLLWEQGRDCALRLHEAGVDFVFGTASGKPGELLERVRTLVEIGLPAEVALDALTRGAAEFLGVGQRLGSLSAGRDATFTLWRADPLTDEDASPAWIFVDGFPSELEEPPKKKDGDRAKGAGPGKGIDPTGTWLLEFSDAEGVKEATLALEMEEDGALSGTLAFDNPMGGPRIEAEVEGQVDGDQLELECTLDFGEFEIESSFSARIDGDRLEGENSFVPPGSTAAITQSFQAARRPE